MIAMGSMTTAALYAPLTPITVPYRWPIGACLNSTGPRLVKGEQHQSFTFEPRYWVAFHFG